MSSKLVQTRPDVVQRCPIVVQTRPIVVQPLYSCCPTLSKLVQMLSNCGLALSKLVQTLSYCCPTLSKRRPTLSNLVRSGLQRCLIRSPVVKCCPNTLFKRHCTKKMPQVTPRCYPPNTPKYAHLDNIKTTLDDIWTTLEQLWTTFGPLWISFKQHLDNFGQTNVFQNCVRVVQMLSNVV